EFHGHYAFHTGVRVFVSGYLMRDDVQLCGSLLFQCLSVLIPVCPCGSSLSHAGTLCGVGGLSAELLVRGRRRAGEYGLISFVYGCCGFLKISSVSPTSTILPKYITMMRSAIWRTTPRSCEIKR